MVELVDRVHEKGAKVFSFIDNPGTILTQPNKQDYLIVYPMNEQLKFYMVANYLMYKNGEFDDYDRYNKEMEANLADVLVQVEKDSDEWAYEYAKIRWHFGKNIKIFLITLLDQEISMGQPIPMLCAIGRSRCGSVQNLLAVKNFSTECRRLSLKIHQLLCLWERMNNDH